MILLYAAGKNRVVESLKKAITEQLPYCQLIHCRSLSLMEQRLRHPRHDIEIVLISVNDAIEMHQIYVLRPLIIDLRVVLVLPGREPDLVAWAHKLLPRFIAYADNGCDQVTAVLNKMLNAGNVLSFPAVPGLRSNSK